MPGTRRARADKRVNGGRGAVNGPDVLPAAGARGRVRPGCFQGDGEIAGAAREVEHVVAAGAVDGSGNAARAHEVEAVVGRAADQIFHPGESDMAVERAG